MKALTPNKLAATTITRTDRSAAKATAKSARREEAQCCAKTSRTTAGCHD